MIGKHSSRDRLNGRSLGEGLTRKRGEPFVGFWGLCSEKRKLRKGSALGKGRK